MANFELFISFEEVFFRYCFKINRYHGIISYLKWKNQNEQMCKGDCSKKVPVTVQNTGAQKFSIGSRLD